MFYILSTLCFVAGALAHPPPLCADDPICPNVPTVANFDKNQYSGRWYEQARLENGEENDVRCVNTVYSLNRKTGVMVLIFHAMNKTTGSKNIETAVSIAPTDQTEASKFSIKLYGHPVSTRSLGILDTDYDTYAFIHSCDPDSGRIRVSLTTREPEPNEFDIADLMEKARGLKIDVSLFRNIDQTDCDYYSSILRYPFRPGGAIEDN